MSPLLSHRSNRVLSVTVTGEGFPTLVVPSVKGALVSIETGFHCSVCLQSLGTGGATVPVSG